MWRRTVLPLTSSVLAGCLVAAGFAPLSWWWAVFFGLTLFFHTLLRSSSYPRAAVHGALFGLAFFGIGVSWLSRLSLMGMFGLVAVGAGSLVVAAVLLRLVACWPGSAFWMAGIWLSAEAVFGRWPFGGFPWLRLGYTMTDTWLGGWLPWVGVPGLGFLIVASCGGMALVLHGQAGRLPVAVALVACWAIGFTGHAYLPVVDTAEVAVGYVQGGAPGGGLTGLGRARSITRNQNGETLRLLQDVASGTQPQPDFIVWPENATDMDPFQDDTTHRLVTSAQRAAGVPVLLGAILSGPEDGERQTASLWWTSEGVTARYVKRDLVPFGEYLPRSALLEPLYSLIPILDQVGDQSVPGTDPGALVVTVNNQEVVIGTIICYEVAHDDTVHQTVTAGAHLLVVQSSNAMFQGTAQLQQQLDITRARAAELRREILVVTTSGSTALIDARGQVVFVAPTAQAASGVVTLPLRSVVTPAVVVSVPLEVGVVAVTAAALLLALAKSLIRQPSSAEREPETGISCWKNHDETECT